MGEIYRFSAPGRTEISGNHTDHQHGCVLAAAVNLETVAQVEMNGADLIRVQSEGISRRTAYSAVTTLSFRCLLPPFNRIMPPSC